MSLLGGRNPACFITRRAQMWWELRSDSRRGFRAPRWQLEIEATLVWRGEALLKPTWSAKSSSSLLIPMMPLTVAMYRIQHSSLQVESLLITHTVEMLHDRNH